MWFEPYKGNKYFPGFTRTYMERHVCYTISYSKLACGIEKGGGLEMGFGGTRNVSTWLSLLTPSSPFFFLFFHFYLAKEADGPDFKPKLLVRVPKVSKHDIDDRNLIDFGSINLHHSLSVALPRLQQERHRGRRQTVRTAHPRESTHTGTFLSVFRSVLSREEAFKSQLYTALDAKLMWVNWRNNTSDETLTTIQLSFEIAQVQMGPISPDFFWKTISKCIKKCLKISQ